MRRIHKTWMMLGGVLALATLAQAQSVVQVGKGSYASYTPLQICRSDYHAPGDYGFKGDQSKYMQYRTLYLHERDGQPIPTNDWWTNLITQPYSGRLWSYPQFVQAQKYGVDVQSPSTWMSNGTEMRSNTCVSVRGLGFNPVSAVAERWHDWDVAFSMTDGNKQMYTTMAHGMPFTWIETRNIVPQVTITRSYQALSNMDGQTPRVVNEKGESLSGTQVVSRLAFVYGNDVYGIYLPTGSEVTIQGTTVTIHYAGARQFIVVGMLHSVADLATMSPFAYSVPRDTKVSWQYDAAAGKVRTRWIVHAENLLTAPPVSMTFDEATLPVRQPATHVLQGFMPHQYRDTGNDGMLSFNGQTYATPHGELRMAEGSDFQIDYSFYGMLPYYAVPASDDCTQNPYDESKMLEMLNSYADKGSFGADTYWGGKGLTQMALNMMFAREMGQKELFEKCRKKLKDALVNWLTYTPGEQNYFFARYDRWGAMVGYSTSYDSETFNDHHFHYGYFTYAAALLALVDDDFKKNYGELITLIAKDYANWDHDDQRFPFFRTFDPWAGHSFAGGMGDDNGNGQESTSEAMQGWGGLYLLGVALENDAMRDAGLFGWLSEARGTAEYWFDRHQDPNRHISLTDLDSYHSKTSDNSGYNIRYDLFSATYSQDGVEKTMTPPYNSNLTCHGVGYWTYFGFDAIFMQGIQWMPISPALDYLSEDKEFAAWDYARMWKDKMIGGWLQSDQTSTGYLGASGGWGNVALSYLQRSNPEEAARIFDDCWTQGEGEFKNYDTNGITYFVTHSHLTYGDLDWSIHASIPSARVYNKKGVKTYMAFNPTDKILDVTFSDGYRLEQVPPRRLKVSGTLSRDNTDIYQDNSGDDDPRAQLFMQNLALGKQTQTSSNENDASMNGSMAVDGNDQTRWASKQQDGQWISVDLGRPVKLYKTRIHWEAAYATDYDIFLSDDGTTWRKSQNVSSTGGWKETLLGDEVARYVKVVGNKRVNDSWGISIYELQVFGQYTDAAESDLLGVTLTADQEMLRQHEPTHLHVKGYTIGGQWVDVPTTLSSDDGTVTSDGLFTPSVYPNAKVKAVSGTIIAERSFPVEEAIFTGYLTLGPKDYQVPVGEPLTYQLEAQNQFHEPIALAANEVTWRVCTYEVTGVYHGKDQWGNPKDYYQYQMTDTPQGTVDGSSREVIFSAAGQYAVIASSGEAADTAFVEARSYSDMNLALGKPVEASTENGDNTAAKVTDGSTSTRWESLWNNTEELITVDLQALYAINKVVLVWEPAYADVYDLDVSANGADWHTVKNVNNGKGGTEELTFPVENAQYVRIHGKKKHLSAYGYSLFELEVYGTGKVGEAVATLTDKGLNSVQAHELTGIWSDDAFASIDQGHAGAATAYDLREVRMKEGTSFDTENPNALVIISPSQRDLVTNSNNVVVQEGTAYQSPSIAYQDGQRVNNQLSIAAQDVSYRRELIGGYATLALPFDAELPAGVTAYELSGYEDKGSEVVISFREAEELKAGVPYVIHADASTMEMEAENVMLTFTEKTLRGSDNGKVSFVSSFSYLTPSEKTMTLYTLQTVDGHKLEPLTLLPKEEFRGYIQLADDLTNRDIRLVYEGEATGIKTVESDEIGHFLHVYSINGQQVSVPGKSLMQLRPGVYIVNGKKVIIR